MHAILRVYPQTNNFHLKNAWHTLVRAMKTKGRAPKFFLEIWISP